MRFMIVVKATPDSDAGVLPTKRKITEMARYHEELQAAGMLVDARGLQDDGPAEIEVRERFALDDFEPGEGVDQFRAPGVSGARTVA
jgi:hypothetical protein